MPAHHPHVDGQQPGSPDTGSPDTGSPDTGSPDSGSPGTNQHCRNRLAQVRIVHLTGPVFDALAAGDLVTAVASSPVPLTDYFAGPDWRSVWTMRSEQVRLDPAGAAWVTGIIWDAEQQLAVGRAGYHGPPDAAGMVEIGYAVVPAHRRKGYARAALVSLLQRAADDSRVRTVRVCISPANTASLSLALQYGFVPVGTQWDDEDGEETVYELSANR